MKQFTALLCFALLAFSNAQSPIPLVSEDCNATETQANLALEEINKDRKEGFVFSLFRVVGAYSEAVGAGHIYYFTIDVVETKCSVLGGNKSDECELRNFHQTVFGQCKAVLHLNRPRRIVKLLSYSCIISPIPSRLIVSMCPDCPTLAEDLTPYIAIAKELVVKYNNGSENTNYFKLLKVEKGSMQWVFGPSHFVEFTIKETSCPRLQANVSDCEFLEDGQAHTGLCKGGQYENFLGLVTYVSCEIYNPKLVHGKAQIVVCAAEAWAAAELGLVTGEHLHPEPEARQKSCRRRCDGSARRVNVADRYLIILIMGVMVTGMAMEKATYMITITLMDTTTLIQKKANTIIRKSMGTRMGMHMGMHMGMVLPKVIMKLGQPKYLMTAHQKNTLI